VILRIKVDHLFRPRIFGTLWSMLEASGVLPDRARSETHDAGRSFEFQAQFLKRKMASSKKAETERL
jgi:hypothetical protein